MYKVQAMCCLPVYIILYRRMMPMLQASLEAVDVSRASSVKAFANSMSGFIRYHDIHSKHEDDIIFPTAARWFPGIVYFFDSLCLAANNTLDQSSMLSFSCTKRFISNPYVLLFAIDRGLVHS